MLGCGRRWRRSCCGGAEVVGGVVRNGRQLIASGIRHHTGAEPQREALAGRQIARWVDREFIFVDGGGAQPADSYVTELVSANRENPN